jgi:hypothetical protein
LTVFDQFFSDHGSLAFISCIFLFTFALFKLLATCLLWQVDYMPATRRHQRNLSVTAARTKRLTSMLLTRGKYAAARRATDVLEPSVITGVTFFLLTAYTP